MISFRRFIVVALAASLNAGAVFASDSPAKSQVFFPHYQPLTATERWRRFVSEAFLSPRTYLTSLSASAVAVLAKDPPEWREGVDGFAKNSASMFGLFTIQTTIRDASAAALGLDTRYQRCDCAGFWKRSAHAVKWSFLTRSDGGKTWLDLPGLAGNYGSGMLSMFWYPRRFQPLTDGVRTGNQQVGSAVSLNLIREFGPDLKRFLGLKR